jgi:hypothetical protein
MTSLVVSRDGDVDKFKRGIGVSESNNRNVNVGRLTDSLVIYSRVCDDDQTGFLERTGDVIGK